MKRVGLLALDICTRGGIQSFMQRIAEVIGDMLVQKKIDHGYCLSLKDSSESLRDHPAIPPSVEAWGAAGSKSRLILNSFRKCKLSDILVVGHVHASPVAWALKNTRRIRAYHVILHGIEAWRELPRIQRTALLGAQSIIATTRYTADECARLNNIPSDRFQVIPLCADERSVEPSDGFVLNGGFKLLCVARQDTSERYKGFEHLYEALIQLAQMRPDIHLNLVGTGNDQERMKERVRRIGLESHVTFWGALSDNDLAAAYQSCDLFVMPSKKEGFGIVFLEAMKAGKPCIGGNHGGTPDVIDHNKTGYLVEYGDVEDLANKIWSLVENEELRHSMGEYGKVAVAERFSASKFRNAYVEFLTKSSTN